MEHNPQIHQGLDKVWLDANGCIKLKRKLYNPVTHYVDGCAQCNRICFFEKKYACGNLNLRTIKQINKKKKKAFR